MGSRGGPGSGCAGSSGETATNGCGCVVDGLPADAK